jgi:hypothetical protein
MRVTSYTIPILLAAVLAGLFSCRLDAQPVPRVGPDPFPRFDEQAALREAKAQGIPPSDIAGWLQFKRLEFAANRWQVLPPPPPNACINGDLELGSFTNWQALAGSNTTGNGLSLGSSALLPGRHSIVSGSSVDSIVPAIPLVLSGSYGIRLGNAAGGSQAEALTFSFTVTPANQNFTFSYAMVMEDPGHTAQDQPFFMYEVRTASGSVIKTVRRTANASDPYFRTVAGPNGTTIVYKNWDCDSIDLKAYVGQAMTITFTTGDCGQGGHFGYAYIDDLCALNLASSFTLPEATCAGTPLFADGSASKNEKDYFWSIEESDANWGRNPSTEVSEWFLANQAGKIDLNAFYASKGGAFKCNKYYRIKLAVRNSCEAWKETVKLIFIRCLPPTNAGPDHFFCCDKAASALLGTPGIAGNSYSWASEPAGFTSTSPTPTLQVTCGGAYTVTVTDSYGCKTSDTAFVRIDKPFDLSIKAFEASVDVCGRSSVLTPELTDRGTACAIGQSCLLSGRGPQASYLWSTGSTEFSIGVNPTTPTTYSVTATNACTTKSAQVQVTPCAPLTGGFPSLIFPNAFTPNGDGKNDTFVIFHLGINAGDKPAYNALNWKFIVWDRWGQEVVNLDGGEDKTRCQGIPNGAIPNWDGRGGRRLLPLPLGVYTWRLYLKNCTSRDYLEVKTASVTIVR